MKRIIYATAVVIAITALFVSGCVENTMHGVGTVLTGIGTDIQNACENSASHNVAYR